MTTLATLPGQFGGPSHRVQIQATTSAAFCTSHTTFAKALSARIGHPHDSSQDAAEAKKACESFREAGIEAGVRETSPRSHLLRDPPLLSARTPRTLQSQPAESREQRPKCARQDSSASRAATPLGSSEGSPVEQLPCLPCASTLEQTRMRSAGGTWCGLFLGYGTNEVRSANEQCRVERGPRVRLGFISGQPCAPRDVKIDASCGCPLENLPFLQRVPGACRVQRDNSLVSLLEQKEKSLHASRASCAGAVRSSPREGVRAFHGDHGPVAHEQSLCLR